MPSISSISTVETRLADRESRSSTVTREWIGAYRELTRERHRSAVGLAIDELPTPALVLDLDVAIANVRKMAAFLGRGPVGLRPHVKVHKSPDAAAIQIAHGAHGVSTATASEAAVMLRSGIEDVLIANQVVGEVMIDTVAELAGEGRVSVAVDDRANIHALGRAAERRGTEVGVLIEYDVGMGRSGARTLEELRQLIDAVSGERALRLHGLMGYEGHCMSIDNRRERTTATNAAMSKLEEAVSVAEAAGAACAIVSGGGTGTYFASGSQPPLTETQAGSYMVMDGYHAQLVPEFEQALYVVASVVSRHDTVAVLDSGRKGVSTDLKLPDVLRDQTSIAFIHEEHLGVAIRGTDPLRVNDRVYLRPGYGPMTVNLYDAYFVAQDGVVRDIWPVFARHPAS